MTVLAGQIVTGKTLRHVRNLGPDLVWRIGEKRVPVFDKFSERILTNLADVGSRPLCQINRDRLCGRPLIASYPYTGTQSSNYEPNTLHRATVRICSLGSKCDIMRVLKIFNVNIFAAARNTEDFLAFELRRWGHTARV
jgi:hypothetical protein